MLTRLDEHFPADPVQRLTLPALEKPAGNADPRLSPHFRGCPLPTLALTGTQQGLLMSTMILWLLLLAASALVAFLGYQLGQTRNLLVLAYEAASWPQAGSWLPATPAATADGQCVTPLKGAGERRWAGHQARVTSRHVQNDGGLGRSIS